jgi:CRISPR-associated exonuclease Cas4
MIITAGFLLLIVAVVVFWISKRQQRDTGMPSGRVVYTDTRGWGKLERPLYDPESGLTGKPDYLVEQEDGETLVPVEVKSARAPSVPYDSHVFQLAAYCFLVERTYGKRPPFGLLRYRDRTFAIDYTPALEEELENLLEQMRADGRKVGDKPKRASARQGLDRSHEEPARCAHCGYRSGCNQRL